MSIFEQLKRDEGLRLTPYKDTVGKLTIGYGRNLDDVGISAEEAETMLLNDVHRTINDLNQHFPWFIGMDEVRQAVVINMAFNMGLHSLMEFKNTLFLMSQGEYDEAAEEMLKSKWAEQVGPRAHRLALQMRSGEFQ